MLLLPGQEMRSRRTGPSGIASWIWPTRRRRCLPCGPTRGLQSTNPFQIIQTSDLIAIITEHIDYRMIYMDGRGHPEDILDYPEWMGHSTGRWDGDTLVVDTIGMREETWLDTAGFEHSAKLRITERFQKTGPDAVRLTVTIDDPVFYSKPFMRAGTCGEWEKTFGSCRRVAPTTNGRSWTRCRASRGRSTKTADVSEVTMRGARFSVQSRRLKLRSTDRWRRIR